jgi:hypothetical protein
LWFGDYGRSAPGIAIGSHDALHKQFELDLAPTQSLQFLVGLHIGKWRNHTMKSDHWIYTVVINNFVVGMEQFRFQSIE